MQVFICVMTSFKSNSAGFLANHMARLFAKGLAGRVEPLGLAPAQFMTLLELWDADGLTQQELRLRLEVEQATMANTLNRMERDGLITRRAHKSDKRARLVYLTDKAMGLRDQALMAAAAQNASAMAGLTESEHQQLIALMQKVIGCMQRG